MSAQELGAGAVSLEHVQAVVRCLDPVQAHVPPAALAAGEVSCSSTRRSSTRGGIVAVVLGRKSEPLSVGRSRYVVPVAIRRALTARDQGCSAPGCARPSGWCDAHHITHWATGGETKLKNLTLVCSFHHHMTHHDGWDIAIGDDDMPEWLPPRWIDPARKPQRNARFTLRALPPPPP